MKKMCLIWFFCLTISPSIFAQQTVGLFLNDSLAQNGYTLFSPNKITYLIDNCGFVVNTWPTNSSPGLSAYLLEDGSLLRAGSTLGSFMGAGAGGRLQIYSWEGQLEWSYDYSTDQEMQHHDIEPLPNGNILVLAWEYIAQDSALAAGRRPEVTNKAVWPEKIVELQPIGSDSAAVVWEWRAWDHLIQDYDSSLANFGNVGAHPELIDANFAAVAGEDNPAITGIDWLHANSLDYHPERDEIILSLRNFSECWVIDHSTSIAEAAGHSGGRSGRGGDLLYRWGNPQAYRQGSIADQQFFQQHDARWIPTAYPNAGKIMVYNNGNGRPLEEYSSADIIAPPLDADGRYLFNTGTSFGPATLSRTIAMVDNERFFSSFMSGAHPLPNGNILLSVAKNGHFFEITPDDQLVWEYRNPVSLNGPVPQGATVPFQSVFRATRYPSDFIGFRNVDLTPGDPIELDPLPSDCVLYGETVGVRELGSIRSAIRLFPNPVGEQLTLALLTDEQVSLVIYDLQGRVLATAAISAEHQLNTTDWPKGIYLIQVLDKKGKTIGTEKVWKN